MCTISASSNATAIPSTLYTHILFTNMLFFPFNSRSSFRFDSFCFSLSFVSKRVWICYTYTCIHTETFDALNFKLKTMYTLFLIHPRRWRCGNFSSCVCFFFSFHFTCFASFLRSQKLFPLYGEKSPKFKFSKENRKLKTPFSWMTEWARWERSIIDWWLPSKLYCFRITIGRKHMVLLWKWQNKRQLSSI